MAALVLSVMVDEKQKEDFVVDIVKTIAAKVDKLIAQQAAGGKDTLGSSSLSTSTGKSTMTSIGSTVVRATGANAALES